MTTASIQSTHARPIVNINKQAVSAEVKEPQDIDEQKQVLSRVWLSRAFRRLKKPLEFFDDNTYRRNCLNEHFEADYNDDDPDGLASLLADINAKAEREYKTLIASQPSFLSNLSFMEGQLELNHAEQQLLLLFCVLQEDSSLEIIESCDIGPFQIQRFARTLSEILKCDLREIRGAFRNESILYMSGLIIRENHPLNGFLESQKVTSITRDALFATKPCPDDLTSPLVKPAPASLLTAEHFVGFEKHIALCETHLNNALKHNTPGVNILIYGAPGTGKTEFVRMLAERLNTILLEVPCQSQNHKPFSGKERITLARQSARLYHAKSRLLMFDEAEDVFSESLFNKSAASQHKAWINNFLEQSQLPTIWISNDVTCMDPAALRRFDILLNFDDQSQKSREQQFSNVLHQPLSQVMLATLARESKITTAMVERADKIARVQMSASNDNYENSLLDSLNSCLKAQQCRPLAKPARERNEFSPAFINCDINFNQLLDGLRLHHCGRLCLYGPPGTGKSAFAQWLGEQLEMPVLLKRASDIKGKYIGENEKNIANAFTQARQQQAILVIDEVDSFLGQRNDNSAGWEASTVNELLTQLETFDGIFIASTNLMDNLDEAAMRRFDLKLHFDYLTSTQRELIFSQQCQLLDLDEPDEQSLQRVRSQTCLTPGDFALLARRQRLLPIRSPSEFADVLARETGFKRNNRSSIGF